MKNHNIPNLHFCYRFYSIWPCTFPVNHNTSIHEKIKRQLSYPFSSFEHLQIERIARYFLLDYRQGVARRHGNNYGIPLTHLGHVLLFRLESENNATLVQFEHNIDIISLEYKWTSWQCWQKIWTFIDSTYKLRLRINGVNFVEKLTEDK